MNFVMDKNKGVAMTNDAIQQIELLTPTDYLGALKRIEPTDGQLEMLQVHLAAPDHTVTARHLARALGFAKWNAANLHYGKFAGKLCIELNVHPTTNLSVLVQFSKRQIPSMNCVSGHQSSRPCWN